MKVELILCAIFAVFSVFMTVQDIKTQKVSRWASVALLVAAVAARFVFCEGDERVGFVASAAIGLVVFEAVRLVVKKRLGLADVFYSGSAGALLGFDMWLAACAIACAAAAGVIYLRVRKARRAGRFPANETAADGAKQLESESAARTVFSKDAVLRMPVPFIPCIFFGTIVAKIIALLS